MSPEIEAEITRLTLAATENGSVGPSIRAAMVWAYRDALRAVMEAVNNPNPQSTEGSEIYGAIEDRLK